jgi:putative NADH-flavin reductase
MNVVLFGPTGMIGSRVLNELLSRGHQVKAVVREPSRLESRSGLTAVKGDILDPGNVAAATQGCDAVISAYGPGVDHPETLLDATRSLISGLKKVGVHRLLMVGGAGSLDVAPGLNLVDAPNFPPAWKPISLAHRDALEILRTSELDWTSVSPAAIIEPGARTRHYRTGLDTLLTDDKGESRISAEDFAVAIVNEIEQPKHTHQRFCVAY